ncbi:MAG: D-2-hydroxyacid dehydrogenase [Pseudomonadales bacterium]|jgi:glycerate dehydrogenase|nr:D-2-hydroxyacid dehydrogenase [Pseudomonadales bacterium]MBP9035619.1 D-2-hydroxyacid dehydrogenase [Pseudomonadales bacterium]
MRGVILDAASLGEDVDLAPVLALPGEWVCHGTTPAAAVAPRIRDAEVVLSNKVPLVAGSLAAARRLRLVVVMATGTNNVDLSTATQQGVAVCNVRAYASASVAQHTMLLLLALARNLLPAERAARDGSWSRSPFFWVPGHPMIELGNRRLGIVGHGELGREVARLARAFGMQVAIAALPGRRYADAEGCPRMAFDEMLPWADVISLHCPLSATTRGLIGAPELARMRSTAILINTARGGIVDEQALLQALRAGRLGGAALDTLECEPPPADSPLLEAGLPNLIVTPHVAWASREARQRLVDQLGEILREFRAGRFMNRVN